MVHGWSGDTIAIGRRDYYNRENALVRSASISRVRRKEGFFFFFFYRRQLTKLERNRCEEV